MLWVLLYIVAFLIVAAVLWRLLIRRCVWCGGHGFKAQRGCPDCGKSWDRS